MNSYFTITLALGVSIDSFVVGRHINHRIFTALFLVSFSHFLFFLTGLYAGEFFYKLVGPFMNWLAFIIFLYLTYDALKNFFHESKIILIDNIKKIILITIPLSIDAFAVSASSKSLINDPILVLILVSIFAPFFCFLGYETTHRLAKVSHRSIYFAETIFFAGLAISVLSKHILN